MAYYVVRSEQGPAWNPSRSMREQELWADHVSYINSLLATDKMLLGGPIGDGRPYRAMVVHIAGSEGEVRERLAKDPWYAAEILRVMTIEGWNMIATNAKLDPALAQLASNSS